MAYTALYRKWRPVSFEEVKGQDHIVTALRNQVVSGRIGHAYLFCGTRGTGKTTVAKIFARAVNCENPVQGSPCNVCEKCKAIQAGASVNVVEIDAASNNGVDNIREIRDEVKYSPADGKYRVYIIDEAHMLSTGAFNALLKTLEEPPSYVIFILATTEAHKMPITVLSRCQRYDFRRISGETIRIRLRQLVEGEGADCEEKALAYIAKKADGSMRDAISLLDQCMAYYYGETLTYKKTLEALGAVDHELFGRLLNAILEGNTSGCIYMIDEIAIQGRELSQLVADFLWYLRNLMLLKASDMDADALEMSSEEIAELAGIAVRMETAQVMYYIRVFSELSGQMRYAPDKRVLLEMALLRLCNPAMVQEPNALLLRVEALERKLEGLERGIPFSNPCLDEGGAVSPGSLAGREKTQEGIGRGDGLPPEGVDRGASLLQEGAGPSPGNESGLGGETSRQEAEEQIVKLDGETKKTLDALEADWPKITGQLGGASKAALKNTYIKADSGDCYYVVFPTQEEHLVGNRPEVLERLREIVSERYGIALQFRARLEQPGETKSSTRYVTEDEVQNVFNIEVTSE